MTVSEMALPDGSAPLMGSQPVGVNARARVKRSVTASDRKREQAGTSRFTRVLDVVYLDTTDSWIAQERSPSAKTVWATDYTAHLDKPWKPYRAWAKAYRPIAVTVALVLDAVKFLLIHPLRGPVALAVAAYLITLWLG